MTVAGMAAYIKELEGIIRDLTDEDDCHYDHHGYCQTHYWFYDDNTCPHKRAKALIKMD
jgi:hypothetical protein